MGDLTHFDEHGAAQMVEIGGKPETHRVARASGTIAMLAETLARIEAGQIAKGDVLGVARIAAISGLKRTSELIPLCHPIRVTGVNIEFHARRDGVPRIEIAAAVHAFDRTGVEMEALAAVSIAALTIYDMCKAVDRGMRIGAIQLEAKSGGKSGDWTR